MPSLNSSSLGVWRWKHVEIPTAEAGPLRARGSQKLPNLARAWASAHGPQDHVNMQEATDHGFWNAPDLGPLNQNVGSILLLQIAIILIIMVITIMIILVPVVLLYLFGLGP